MNYSLTMTFLTATGEKSNIIISDVRDNITETEAFALMDTIVSNNVFTSKNGDLTAKYSAALTQKEVTKFEV